MTNGTIAFLVAISASAWVYSKLSKSTGGNTGSSIIASGIIGLVIFVALLGILSMMAK